MTDCIFCKIAKKEREAYIVYEDERVVAFLDIHPVNRGHTLVIPKKHFQDIHEISEEEISHLYKAVKKISDAIKKTLKPEGISVAQNNGKIAGQIIFHFHTHIIPKNKEFHMRYEAEREELNKIAEEIRNQL